MTSLFFVVKILTGLSSVVLACAIFSRDPGLRINRLMAVVPTLIAFWSLGEFWSSLQPDRFVAEHMTRATAIAWTMLGPACLHIYAELVGARRPMARRLVPIAYFFSTIIFLLHWSTGFGLATVAKTPWGYGVLLNPSSLFLFATLSAPIAYVLIGWRGVESQSGASDEHKGWSKFYLAVVSILSIVAVTDFILPNLGVLFPSLGSTGGVIVTFTIAHHFKRYGYSLLAPGAFSAEILEALRDGIVLLRANGEVRIANSAFEQMVGATQHEIQNVSFVQFAPSLGVGPGTMTEPIECELITQQGKPIPVLIAPTPLHSPSGNVRGAALVIRDLREVSALRGSLAASDRLATVGGLSASIAEEIREPIHEMRSQIEGMRSQLGCLTQLVRRCDSTEILAELVGDREELIDECLEGVERIEAIVRDVRGFASDTSGLLEPVDLNALVEDALRIALVRARSEIEVERNFEQLRPVLCVPGEIVQVLVNLLVNAIHATAGEGRVQLSSWQHDSEVWLCIEDNGSGIAADLIARIFDPFFTTKPVGEGTGLGLAISHRIIRNHGGGLRVESELGRGARFTVVLPLDPGAPCGRGAVSGLASG